MIATDLDQDNHASLHRIVAEMITHVCSQFRVTTVKRYDWLQIWRQTYFPLFRMIVAHMHEISLTLQQIWPKSDSPEARIDNYFSICMSTRLQPPDILLWVQSREVLKREDRATRSPRFRFLARRIILRENSRGNTKLKVSAHSTRESIPLHISVGKGFHTYFDPIRARWSSLKRTCFLKRRALDANYWKISPSCFAGSRLFHSKS